MRASVALIGSLLIDPDAIHQVRALVEPEDFENAAGQETFRAMLAVVDSGDDLDFVTLCDELERRGTFWTVVQPHHLASSINLTPASTHALSYARRVADAAAERRPARAPSLAERLGLAS